MKLIKSFKKILHRFTVEKRIDHEKYNRPREIETGTKVYKSPYDIPVRIEYLITADPIVGHRMRKPFFARFQYIDDETDTKTIRYYLTPYCDRPSWEVIYGKHSGRILEVGMYVDSDVWPVLDHARYLIVTSKKWFGLRKRFPSNRHHVRIKEITEILYEIIEKEIFAPIAQQDSADS